MVLNAFNYKIFFFSMHFKEIDALDSIPRVVICRSEVGSSC